MTKNTVSLLPPVLSYSHAHQQAIPLVKATSSNLGGAGVHVTTTLTKLEELPVEEPPQPVNPVLYLLSERELTVNEEVSLLFK